MCLYVSCFGGEKKKGELYIDNFKPYTKCLIVQQLYHSNEVIRMGSNKIQIK